MTQDQINRAVSFYVDLFGDEPDWSYRPQDIETVDQAIELQDMDFISLGERDAIIHALEA